MDCPAVVMEVVVEFLTTLIPAVCATGIVWMSVSEPLSAECSHAFWLLALALYVYTHYTIHTLIFLTRVWRDLNFKFVEMMRSLLGLILFMCIHKGKVMPKASRNSRDEAKKRKNIMMTPTAERILQERAEALNLSVSEYLERFARNELPDAILLPNTKEREILGELLGITSFSASG